ncbi:MAG: membrane dipeptidase [Firmicutes bacterium]|nr:membrane dipeptidase [Bacillota bacterium]
MKYSVFDTHCDTLSALADGGGSFDKNTYNVDLERMERYESYTQVMACFISPEHKRRAKKRTLDLIKTYKTRVAPLVKDSESVKTILSIEGGEGIDSIMTLRRFHLLGVRLIALTWNFKNHLASGADAAEGGVTPFGRRVIRKMNDFDIFLDVSHLNDHSFYDAAECTALPIIASHSCSRSVRAHRRNLTDDMFKIIMRSGGCVGINLYAKFLTESDYAEVDDVVKHIEHFMSLGGENHIGMGCDFDGVENHLPRGIRGCADLYKIFDRLLQLNYSEEQVNKISRANFERVFEKY